MEIKEAEVLLVKFRKIPAKLKKQQNKRKTSSIDSCVRTDLLHLKPNLGKTIALEKIFENYKKASVDIAGKL